MAKASGVLKIEGTIEELTFYKRDRKDFVRKKGGVSRERIKTDPNYVRTRENNTEFGMSMAAVKLLRDGLGSMVFRAKDSRLNNRLMQLMTAAKNLDSTSVRGQREVANGIVTADGKLLLEGFDFNGNSKLNSVLHAPFTLQTTTGVVTIADLITAEDLHFPEGATHVSFQSGIVSIDFATEQYQLAVSNVTNVLIEMAPTTVTLTPASVPSAYPLQVFVLSISFFQKINGIQYSLRNEEYNVLNVIGVV